MAPLIPYIPPLDIPLNFLKPVADALGMKDAHPAIHSFGALVATGVYIGSIVAMRHAKERKYDAKKMNDFIFYVVGLGFVGGHMLDAIFYHPDRLAKDPIYLIRLWDGLSSYGGFIGAVIGAIIYKYRFKAKILGFCEAVNSAFPLAWVFGRAGCASVHDHPGRLSNAWFAIKDWKGYPSVPPGMGRLDLGLIECVLTIPLAVYFLWAWRKNPHRRLGFYTGIMCMAYAPVRFGLDFLRITPADLPSNPGEADPRYFGLTPAQWACFGLFAMGAYFYNLSRKDLPDETPREDDKKDGKAKDDGEATDEADDDEEAARAKRKAKRKKKKAAAKAASEAPEATTKEDPPSGGEEPSSAS